MFESGIVNFGGQLFGVSAPRYVQSFFALLACLIMLRLLLNSFKAFKEARKNNCVFSRKEVQELLESELLQIQNILEDAGIKWEEPLAYQWLLYLARKIRVRARIVLVDNRRYEAAGFTKLDDFWRKADLRLGASADVATRMEDGTVNWQKTETLKICQEVIANAKAVARSSKFGLSTPVDFHRIIDGKS